MTYPIAAAQTALYDVLDGDATLGTLMNGVFDHVPQETAYPYIVIGEQDAQDWPNFVGNGVQLRFTLQVFSREAGKQEVQQIIARMQILLHEASISVSGATCVLSRVVSQRVAHTLSDGETIEAGMVVQWWLQY